MNFSTQIKDSTLRETSCTNHVHYLEVGNYMPILHPTANTSLPGTDARMNKIFIAAYDYAEGDVYSIFGQELSLVNRDLKIYTGDYVKATIDFSDNSIKLVNISRVTYTPNTELGDIDYTYDRVIGSSAVTIHEQKILLTENTDITINTTAYANMPIGTLYLDLYDGNILLNTSAYNANISKRYMLQNAYSMPDMPIDSHLEIKVKLRFEKDDPSDPDCVLENRAAMVSVTGKNIEWDYPVWRPEADDEIGYYYQEELDNTITLLYPFSKENRYKIGKLPAEVNDLPVKTINQILLYNFENSGDQSDRSSIDILEDLVENDDIVIEGGGFYRTKIGMVFPNDKAINAKPYAFANSLVREDTAYSLNQDLITFINTYWHPYNLEINDTNWMNSEVPPYCFYKCPNIDSIFFLSEDCVTVREGAFAGLTIEKLFFGDRSVTNVDEKSFENSSVYNLEFKGDYPDFTLRKFHMDGSVFGDIKLPRIDDSSFSRVYGKIEYNQDRFYHYDEDSFGHKTHNYYSDENYWETNVKTLVVNTLWQNAEYSRISTEPNPPTELVPLVIPFDQSKINIIPSNQRHTLYEDIFLGKTLETVSLQQAYCSKFSIEKRNKSVEIDYRLFDVNDVCIVDQDDSYNKGFFIMADDCYWDQQDIEPLVIDYLDLRTYYTNPKIKLHVVATSSGSSYSYKDTYFEVLNKLEPIDFRHVIFTKNTDLQHLFETHVFGGEGDIYYSTTGNTSSMSDVRTVNRVIFPPYLPYIPKYTGVQKKCQSSSTTNSALYFPFYARDIGGTIMDLPATDTIRQYTFVSIGNFGPATTLGYSDRFIQCRKIERYGFYDNYVLSTQYGIGDGWGVAMIAYGCEEIESSAFYGFYYLTRFLVPPTVRTLGNSAFYCGYTSSSTSVKIALPDTLNGSGFYNNGYRGYSYSFLYYDSTYQSYFTFSDSGDYSTITGFDTPNTNNLYQYMGTYIVPEYHGDKQVTAMNAVFNNKNGLSTARYAWMFEIVIQAKLSVIAGNTFNNCQAIRRIIVPDTVTEIGANAFKNCLKLNRLEFEGDGVIYIGESAFAEVGHSKDIYQGLNNAIPNSSSSYEWNRYKAYTDIIYPLLRVNNNKYETEDFFMPQMSVRPFKFTDNILTIGARAFMNSVVPVGAIRLPENSSYTAIEIYTFSGAPYITSLYIPDTITRIKSNSLEFMYECEYIRIPNTAVLETTFEGCESLKAISYVFTQFLPGQFKNCHELVQFMDKGIADIEANGKLQSSIASIPNYCFYNCESISNYTWIWSDGRDVSDPTPITIGNYSFYGCKSLTTLNAHKAVTSIGDHAFEKSGVDGDSFCFLFHSRYNWERVDENSYTLRAFPIGKESMFAGDENLVVIDLPLGYYNCTSGRVPVQETYEFPTAVGMYEDCKNLTTITFHPYFNGVQEFVDSTLVFPSVIPERCFKGTNLDSATINYILTFVTTISAGAFRGNTSITSITIPANVTSIGDYAFADCPNLTEIKLSNQSVTLGVGVFKGCSSLNSIGSATGYSYKYINLPDSCFEDCDLSECEDVFVDLESAGTRCFANSKMVHPVFPIAYYGDECFADSEFLVDCEFTASSLNRLTIGKCCFINNPLFETFILPNNTAELAIGSAAFEFDTNITMSPHELYNAFSKVIFLGRFSITGVSSFSIGNIFNATFKGKTVPTYEDVTFSSDFEAVGVDSITSNGYSAFQTVPSVLNVRTYKNITFEKCIPTGAFNTYNLIINLYDQACPRYYRNLVERNGGVSGTSLNTQILSITLGQNFEKICDYAAYTGGRADLNIINNTTGPWTIGRCGLQQFAMTTIDLKNCTTIGEYAFDNNTTITSISNATSITTIKAYAFQKCSNLKRFDFYGVPNIENYAFSQSGVILDDTHIFRDTVKRIGTYAFYNCATVTEVYFDPNVELDYMGRYCFNSSYLTKITFPVNPIGLFGAPNSSTIAYNTWQNAPKYYALMDQAFYGVRMNTTVAPGGVYTIDSNCTTFYGGRTFASLTNAVTTLIIPDTVTDLCATSGELAANYSYYGQLLSGSYITTLRITGSRTLLYSSRFDTEGATCPGLFYGSSRLTTVSLTDTITKIPEKCFYGIGALTTFNIPEACTEIGTYAFYGTRPANNVVYLSQRTMLVKSNAFYNTNITSIYLSNQCVLENNAIPNNCTKYYYEDMVDLTDPKIPGNTPVN